MLVTAKKHRYSVGNGHVWAVLCADSQPFSPGLGKGDEGRSHPELLVPVVKDVQQDVATNTVPIKSQAVCGDADPVQSGTCGWLVGMPRSGPVCWSCLISFSTLIAARGGSYGVWRGDICWAGMGQGRSLAGGSCCAATAVCHYSRKKATFLRWCCGECLTITAELNVLLFFPCTAYMSWLLSTYKCR